MAALRDAIALLPRGVAWSQSPDSRLGRLLDALTRELDRVEARAADLLRESNPATTNELLREWDAIVALDYPGALTSDADKGLARAMVAWLLGTSTLSRASIERWCVLSTIPEFADNAGVVRPLHRLLGVEHTGGHEATIRLLADGGSNSILEALFRRKAHATGTLVFDWVAPAIAITSPASQATVCDELVTVTGTSVGVGDIRVTVTQVGGIVDVYTTEADVDGDWSVQIVLASYLDGETASIVARGYTGIVTPDSGWVESDPITIESQFSVSLSFTGPLTTTESFPTLVGTATPGSTIVVEIRGDQESPVVADGSGDWSVEMDNQNLELGDNAITIFATGPSPCEHEDSIVVEVELESSGGVAPTITVAPVLTWTVEIGESPTLTDPTYTGDAGTITWTLYRDGVADGTIADVSKATAEAYAAVAADIGPDLHFGATVTNGSGSDSANSNSVIFDDAAYLPDTAIGVSTAGLTLADSGTTVDAWAATLGGLAASAAVATAPSPSARPAYSATGGVGGRPLVTSDGSNDALVGASLTRGAAWLDSEMGVVGHRVSYDTVSDTYIGYLDVIYLNDRNVSEFRFTVSGGANINAGVDPGTTPRHFSGDTDASALNARVGGSVVGTAGVSQPSRSDANAYSIFASTIGTRFSAIAIQAWYIGGKLTTDQRTHLRALLTYHTGVAC